MSRSEQPVPDGPLKEFAQDLRALRHAENLTYRQLSERARYSYSVLSTAAAGRILPTLEVTLAYVGACKGDVHEWEERWKSVAEVMRATTTSSAPSVGAVDTESGSLPDSVDTQAAPLNAAPTALIKRDARRHTVRRARLVSAAVLSITAIAGTVAVLDNSGTNPVRGILGGRHASRPSTSRSNVAGPKTPATETFPGIPRNGVIAPTSSYPITAATTADIVPVTNAVVLSAPSVSSAASSSAKPTTPVPKVSAPAPSVYVGRPVSGPTNPVLSSLAPEAPAEGGEQHADPQILSSS